jgi:hypothetical protein
VARGTPLSTRRRHGLFHPSSFLCDSSCPSIIRILVTHDLAGNLGKIGTIVFFMLLFG